MHDQIVMIKPLESTFAQIIGNDFKGYFKPTVYKLLTNFCDIDFAVKKGLLNNTLLQLTEHIEYLPESVVIYTTNLKKNFVPLYQTDTYAIL